MKAKLLWFWNLQDLQTNMIPHKTLLYSNFSWLKLIYCHHHWHNVTWKQRETRATLEQIETEKKL